MRIAAVAIVVLHAVILLGHDWAHRSLGVGLAPWQIVFAYSVIVAAPVVSAVAVFTRFARSGYALLAISMLGSLVFGVYHHYILVSPDHVHHLPAGDGQDIFRATAAMMAAVEFVGVGIAVFALRR
jgi:hypothetical membrane protein